ARHVYPDHVAVVMAERYCWHRRSLFTANLRPGLSIPQPCRRHYDSGTGLDCGIRRLLVRRTHGPCTNHGLRPYSAGLTGKPLERGKRLVPSLMVEFKSPAVIKKRIISP